ncbi:MAG: RrF2 family transcriptional regulator [Bryobacteraceae bacterium]
MIYSRAAEYAIRAFVELAHAPSGRYMMAKQVAAQSDIPAHFLAKILQQLARQGMLKSSKGPTGGFSLRIPAAEISLLRIVEAVDGLEDYRRCIGGRPECNDDAHCSMHDSWKTLRSRIMDYLEGTSIADLAKALDDKRGLAVKPRRGRRTPGKAAVSKKD